MIDIVSDHNMLVECMLCGKSEPRAKAKKKDCRLRDSGWENF